MDLATLDGAVRVENAANQLVAGLWKGGDGQTYRFSPAEAIAKGSYQVTVPKTISSDAGYSPLRDESFRFQVE